MSRCPYVGLQPYSEGDRDYFFGRDRDQRIISRNLCAASLTVLYGASGVGKSSALLAGVVPRLQASPRTAAVVFRDWQGASFLGALKSECLKAVALAQQKALAIPESLPLDDLLFAAARALGGPIVIVLDQFEEYFLYHPETHADTPFEAEFARTVNRDDVDAHFLIALRDDGLSKLDRFRARIPNLLGNTLRLQHLDAAAAEEAIRKPLEVYNARLSPDATPVSIEDDLVGAILAQVQMGRVLSGESAGVGHGGAGELSGRIETPFLQLVMTRLWAEEMGANSSVLRLSTLTRLGGAQEIWRTHLDGVMEKLDGTDQEVCARFFDRLVTPSGNKIAQTVADLTQYAGSLAGHVSCVLKTLSDARILRSIATLPGEPATYEIAHDVLAPAILDWRVRYIQAQDQAEAERQRALAEKQRRAAEHARVARRFRVLAIALTGLLLAASGAATFAIEQRHSAEIQAHLAASSQLAAQARSHSTNQLDLALLLAVEGTTIADTVEARGSLMEGLGSHPHLRAFLSTHPGLVQSVAFSPDGKVLASGTGDSVILWDAATHQPLGPPLTGHAGSVSSVAFSPDGTTLASGSADRTIVLWNVATHRQVGLPLFGHTDRVRSVAFSPDGTTLASGSADKTIILWNVATHRQVGRPLTDHANPVWRVTFSPDGKTLASGSENGIIILWDVGTHQPAGPPLTDHTYYASSLAFSPDGKMLAWSNENAAITLWNIAAGRPVGPPLIGHTGYVSSVAFSPDGKRLASASWDQTIVLWDVGSRGPLGRFAGYTNYPSSVAFSPDGETLASGGEDGTITLWDAVGRHHRLGQLLADDANPVWRVALSPDGKTLASASMDKTITLRDVASHKLIASLTGHTRYVFGLAFSPDGKTLASGSADRTIILWDVATRTPLGPPLTGHTGTVSSVAFSPDGKRLASGSRDQTVILWDLATRTPIASLSKHTGPVSGVAFSPDGKALASAGMDRTIILWDVATRQPVGPPLKAHTGPVRSVAFSPDGKTLGSASWDRTIILWNVGTRQPVGPPLVGHTGPVSSLAFSPDGKMLASGSKDQTVILWDVATRKPIGSLAGHTGLVSSVAFSPDGKTLISGSTDDTVILWDVNLESWKTRACGVANRDLSMDEWRTYLGPDIPFRRVCDHLRDGAGEPQDRQAVQLRGVP